MQYYENLRSKRLQMSRFIKCFPILTLHPFLSVSADSQQSGSPSNNEPGKTPLPGMWSAARPPTLLSSFHCSSPGRRSFMYTKPPLNPAWERRDWQAGTAACLLGLQAYVQRHELLSILQKNHIMCGGGFCVNTLIVALMKSTH